MRTGASIDTSKRLGFLDGLFAVWSGFRRLARTPALWPSALIPALVLAVLETAFVSIAILVGRPWVLRKLGDGSSFFGHVGGELLSWFLIAVIAVAGFVIAMLLAPPLSAPALDNIVLRVEAELGVAARAPLGFFREISSGFRAMAGAFVIGGPVLVGLWIVGLVFPPAAVVTVPLKLLTSSLFVAWGLFDYPLTLRGIGFRERLRLVRAHLGCATGFGVGFTLVFWLPCCGVALLPVGVAAAAELIAKIEQGGAIRR